jgi:hypothetical protein
VSPATAAVSPGGTTNFAAAVTGTANVAVTWSMVEPSDAGTVSSSGVYTAPATPGTYHVRARSVASPTAFGDATATVAVPTCTAFTYSAWGPCTNGQQARTVVSATPAGCTGGDPVLTQSCSPVAVTISPRTATLDACTTQTFTATVANTTNRTVTWRVQESAGGSVTTAGAYTAPSTAGTYHLVATSAADGTATDTATLTVVDHILAVTVSPATVTVQPGGTTQLTATVTTSCGTFPATAQ